jgi:uncharacterized repeat protein (TIGR03803 family)
MLRITQNSMTASLSQLSKSMCLCVALLVALATGSPAQTFTTIHTFTNTPDGEGPFGGLVADGKGNFYGTTEYGGAYGFGTVFELSPSASGWNETIIWSFAGKADGAEPSYQMVVDASGNIFGETQVGGNFGCNCGTVFELQPPASQSGAWTKVLLYTFTGANGSLPYGGLTLDSGGNLYGVKFNGGAFGYGLAFRLAPAAGGYSESTLYAFGNTTAAPATPYGPLLMDSAGNLYGVSQGGGAQSSGTVYRLTPPANSSGRWTSTTLFAFKGAGSGCAPEGNLLMDASGNLYGQATSCGSSNTGLIFRLSPPTISGAPWTEAILHQFGARDGGGFYPSLSFDSSKTNLYGTSFYADSYGVVFELKPPAIEGAPWTEKILHSFTSGSDSSGPLGPIVQDANGVLYGTAFYGINHAQGGTAFSLAP